MKKIRSKVGKGLDVLILATSFIIIVGLLAAGYFGIKGFLTIIDAAVTLDGALFYAALLLGMSAGLMYWLEMWINVLDKAWKSLTLKQELKK